MAPRSEQSYATEHPKTDLLLSASVNHPTKPPRLKNEGIQEYNTHGKSQGSLRLYIKINY